MILAHTHVNVRMVLGSPLTNDDVTGNSVLTAKYFHSQTLAMRLTAVL